MKLAGVDFQYFKEGSGKSITIKPVNCRNDQPVYRAIFTTLKRLTPERTSVINPDDNEPGRPKTRINLKRNK